MNAGAEIFHESIGIVSSPLFNVGVASFMCFECFFVLFIIPEEIGNGLAVFIHSCGSVGIEVIIQMHRIDVVFSDHFHDGVDHEFVDIRVTGVKKQSVVKP